PLHSHVVLHSLYPSLRSSSRTTPFPYTTLFRSDYAMRADSLVFGRSPDAARTAAANVDLRIHLHAAGKAHLPSRRSDRRTPRRKDRKSTRLNSSHGSISYAVFCLIKRNDWIG